MAPTLDVLVLFSLRWPCISVYSVIVAKKAAEPLLKRLKLLHDFLEIVCSLPWIFSKMFKVAWTFFQSTGKCCQDFPSCREVLQELSMQGP